MFDDSTYLVSISTANGLDEITRLEPTMGMQITNEAIVVEKPFEESMRQASLLFQIIFTSNSCPISRKKGCKIC